METIIISKEQFKDFNCKCFVYHRNILLTKHDLTDTYFDEYKFKTRYKYEYLYISHPTWVIHCLMSIYLNRTYLLFKLI